MDQGVFQLVYLSRAVDELSYSDLSEILDRGRTRNKKTGVTGILIYRDGFFIQLLEGPEVDVMKTLSGLIRDRRHHHLQVVHELHATERLFSEWAMAFQDGDLAHAHDQALLDSLFQLARDARRPRLEIMTPLTQLSHRYSI